MECGDGFHDDSPNHPKRQKWVSLGFSERLAYDGCKQEVIQLREKGAGWAKDDVREKQMRRLRVKRFHHVAYLIQLFRDVEVLVKTRSW